MKNKEVADILYEIADLLEAKDVKFKPRAYRRAARNIESLSDPVEDVHERGELEEIDGVGESIAEKIGEYLKTGELAYYEGLKKDFPMDIEALTRVEGVGPKTAEQLYDELGVTDLDDLKDAAEQGEIADIEGFGEKTQQNILDHIEAAKSGEERMLLGSAFPIADNVEEALSASDAFNQVEIVGSFRRRRPTVGDIDILATAEDRERAMDVFCGMEDTQEVLNRGETKASTVVSGGLRMDLRIVDKEAWGAALVYFTGSKDHNITLRERAIERGWKLNEYGLFDTSDTDEEGEQAGEPVARETEEGVYDALGLAYIAPELREDTGEVDAAAVDELPELVTEDDIRGDLQAHTTYSDGDASVAEMAAAAEQRGLDYLLITDHGPSLRVAGGPDSVETLEEQAEEIETADEQHDTRVLHGMEVNITSDGIDVSDAMLDMLDMVVVAMHDRLDNPTDRLVAVIESQPVNIVAHPLNRLINKREPTDLDMDRVVDAAVSNDVALEINAQPERLDLPWDLVKQYRDEVRFVVSTDAHTTGELGYMRLGVAQARRGWLEPQHVLNTRSLDELRKWFT